MPRASSPTPKKDPKSGLWYFAFDSRHPRPDGGRRQVRRSGFPTRRACAEALRQAVQDDRQHVLPLSDVPTIEMILERYLAAKRLAGVGSSRLAQIKWANKRLNDLWGGWPATKLTDAEIEAQYLNLLTRGRRQYVRGKGTITTDRPLSPQAVRQLHVVLNAALQFAVDRRQIPWNPARVVRVAGSSRSMAARPHWTPDQVGRFLDFAAEQKDLPVGLPEVLADTGGRIGEVMGLRWRDFDLDFEQCSGTVTITRQLVTSAEDWKMLEIGPTKRPRSKATIGLHPATVERLHARMVEQGKDRRKMGSGWPSEGVAEDLVFTWPDGQPIHPKTASRVVARLATKAGLPRLTAHGLRHSFATAALVARVPVEVVAARLGDTVRVVQETYAHVIPADDAAAARLVGDLYRAAPPRSA